MRKNVQRITIDLPKLMYSELKERARRAGISMRDYCVSAIGASFREPRTDNNCYLAAPDDERFIDFPQQAATAKVIWVAGLTLEGLARQYSGFLADRVRQGVSLRLLLLNPDLGIDSPILRAVTAWISAGYEPQRGVAELLASVRESVRFFHLLKSQAQEGTQVEVRGHDSTLGFGVTFVDPFSAAGQARVSLYVFGSASGEGRHPALYLVKDSPSATRMYKILLDHFERLWQAARPIT